MALRVVCLLGHSYIAADIYLNEDGSPAPFDMPRCPQCRAKWQRNQKEKSDS